MNPPDYLSAMSRSEAYNYIAHLPGLTRQEFAELITAADKRPEERINTAEYKETADLRVRYLVQYIQSQPHGATRQMIMDALKYNGSNMQYTMTVAMERGLLYIAKRDGKKHVYKVAAAGRKMSKVLE